MMKTWTILGVLLVASGSASALEVSRPCAPPAEDGDVLLIGDPGDAAVLRRLGMERLYFTDGRERIPAEVGGLRVVACDGDTLAAVLVPSRPLVPHTRYWTVDARGSKPVAGELGPFTVGEPRARAAWMGVPWPLAESIVAGTRTVVISIPGVAPRGMVAVTRVRADGSMELTENRPVFNEVATVDVGDDVRAVIVRLVGPSMSVPLRVAIPPAGQIRPAGRRVVFVAGGECAPWRPSVPAGLVLFGLLPFLLAYGAVRSLRRR